MVIKAATADIVTSQIPNHIVEKYPHFVEFLKAYYEWMNLPGNPYERIKNHLDYLNFEKSLDDYVDFMKAEYLSKIPLYVLGNREQFILWSRKLGLARGNHESYKFLFKMLFGEQTTEIYLPKDNILKASDGKWISGQSIMLVTNSGDPDRLLFKRIKQEREIFPGIFERAEATVDSYILRYSNGFNILELTLTDIVGEFIHDHPIFDSNGNTEWPIQTIVGFDIVNAGTNYFKSDQVKLNGFTGQYEDTVVVLEPNKVDTKITASIQKDQFYIEVNDVYVDPEFYDYDGRYLIGSAITQGSTVYFKIMTAYNGSMFVHDVTPDGQIKEIRVLTTPIAIQSDLSCNIISAFGQDAEVIAKIGLVRKVPGYYIGKLGQPSSNMFIQDSNYYQDYSYEIRTERNITEYASIVKDVLHPGGFKMFGNVRVLSMIELLIDVAESDSGAIAQIIQNFGTAKWSTGSKYLWYAKNQNYLSPRMYDPTDWDAAYVNGDVGYDLEDKSLERTKDPEGNPLEITSIGWMTKNPLTDSDIRQPNDYFEHSAYDHLYMEDSYVAGEFDVTGFISKYINLYVSIDYWDEYSE